MMFFRRPLLGRFHILAMLALLALALVGLWSVASALLFDRSLGPIERFPLYADADNVNRVDGRIVYDIPANKLETELYWFYHQELGALGWHIVSSKEDYPGQKIIIFQREKTNEFVHIVVNSSADDLLCGGGIAYTFVVAEYRKEHTPAVDQHAEETLQAASKLYGMFELPEPPRGGCGA